MRRRPLRLDSESGKGFSSGPESWCFHRFEARICLTDMNGHVGFVSKSDTRINTCIIQVYFVEFSATKMGNISRFVFEVCAFVTGSGCRSCQCLVALRKGMFVCKFLPSLT